MNIIIDLRTQYVETCKDHENQFKRFVTDICDSCPLYIKRPSASRSNCQFFKQEKPRIIYNCGKLDGVQSGHVGCELMLIEGIDQ